MSGIITAVIMIALVMVAAVIVWGVVRNIIQGRLEGAESCFGIYEKVTINSRYTCYDSVTDEFQFSMSVGDIDVEKILISISGSGATNSYELSDSDNVDLESYPTAGEEVIMPGKNGGKTYLASGFTTKPDLIKIAPFIDGQLCEVSDSLSDIDDCSSLV